ncbi:MAG: family 78 glycoside hydrolase catalytic domain [Clostridia bacterium]|nr:family 78 glycoside hydrolase catalytic domain [Clostridia bacterium]
MTDHIFTGAWITDAEFAGLEPRNVFHRQLEKVHLPCDEHRNRHILFRRTFDIDALPEKAVLYITADDYYKLYINGTFVTQGPAPAYHFAYGYNTADVTPYLREGRNTIAVHTLYQGLINRVWVSADGRHGLLCDLEFDGKTVLASDGTFLTHLHTGYTETGTVGYATQFLETYDSRAAEVGFEQPDFDDSAWANALPRGILDYTVVPQPTKSLVFETITPVLVEKRSENRLFIDFGATYVGYLNLTAAGTSGDVITIRCAQELDENGEVRYALRANCKYEESWILKNGTSVLDWFDYKSFRYAELTLPEGCVVTDISFAARHYPFSLAASMKPEYRDDEAMQKVWNLCVNSQKYGVQEVIQDCMEREKGFYVGDGCYTALANLILTGDDSIVRKLIDDAFRSTFITPGMVTCLDCAMMQEIAEYPLMLISLILWHYRVCRDREYLAKNYPGIRALLDSYRTDYEKDGLLRDLDKWCVVEWPANFRDGYDVDITEGKVCHEPHVALNAYYIEAIRCTNKIAAILGEEPYRDESELIGAFTDAFYDAERHLFTDSLHSSHFSYIGNVLPFAFGLCPDDECTDNILAWIGERGVTGVSFFGAFPLKYGLLRRGRRDIVESMLRDSSAWLRMIREGATTTFEGWGRDTKWNTSLFHLTLSDAAVFLADVNAEAIFE